MKIEEVYETAYQLLISENVDVVVRDAYLRYGDEASRIVEEAKKLVDRLLSEYGSREDVINFIIMNFGSSIVDLITSRFPNFENVIPIVKYFNKNAHRPSPYQEVLCVVKVLELDLDIDSLIKIGVLMHVDENSLVVPHYLSTYDECSVDIENILDLVSQDYAKLSIIESIVENVKPSREMFQILYGIDIESPELYEVSRVMTYCEYTSSPILNPCIDTHELRRILHEFKQARARRLFRIIEPGMGHVKYSKKIGALVSFIMLGPGEHGILMFMPWIVPSRRVEKYYASSPRLIITSIPFRREFAEYFHNVLEDTKTFKNTAFIFIQEGVCYLVSPSRRSRTLDSLLDIIYRANLEVLEF